MLARHVSDLTGPSSGPFYKLYSQTLVCGTTVRTTYQSLRIQLVQNAPDDGPMRSETCRANISAE